MKFSTVLGLGLAVTGAVANPVKRQGSVFVGIIGDINDAVNSLAEMLQSFETEEDAKAIQAANEELVQLIMDGVDTADGADEMSQSDGLALVSPVNDLAEDVTAVMEELVARKDEVIELGFGGIMKEGLNAQLKASQALTKAFVAKTPDALQEIAEELANTISAAIQIGVDGYKDVEDGPAPTGSATDKPTAEPTAEPTGEPTEEPTAEPTGEPTGEPTDGGPAPTGSDVPSVPVPTPSGPTPTGADPTSPPDSPGAGAINGVSGLGLIAAVAAVIAL